MLGRYLVVLGRLRGVFWESWRVLGASWDILEESWGVLGSLEAVLGSHGLLGVVFASPRPGDPPHLENFGNPKGAQDGAKMRPKTDQNR